MENVIGSAYSIVFNDEGRKDYVEFHRIKEPLTGEDGRRTFVSPDRREQYPHTFDGTFYRLKPV